MPLLLIFGGTAAAQLTDRNISTNNANAGIAKTLAQEIGPVTNGTDAQNRGDVNTDGTSIYIIKRDPFRSIRRGRQVFQRKFTRAEGQGPAFEDACGSLNEDGSAGTHIPIAPCNPVSTGEFHKASGLTDSCAACHGRPKGSAGASGVTFTRPDSRDSPHLFGLGLKEMLADEITQDLRAIEAKAALQAQSGHSVTLPLTSKGINYGKITVSPTGAVDTSQVQGVNSDLRVRQIFADGELFSIREAIIATFKFELGLEASDPVMSAVNGANGYAQAAQTTPSGMVLDPSKDKFLGPPPVAEGADGDNDGKVHEFPGSLVDHMEFYLLNYFTAGTYDPDGSTISSGVRVFNRIGCGSCHIQNLMINRDRRVGNVDVGYDATNGGFNNLFAKVTPQFYTTSDGQKLPNNGSFLVQNIFTDFKRHDLGPNFHENNFDGQTNTMFLTTALWGVGSTAPYGHDGRSINLNEVILRHGGEAQASRDEYAKLGNGEQNKILNMLNALILFPPDDTASNLTGETPTMPGYPQVGHGAIALGKLFNLPTCPSPATTVTCGPE